ncbi:alpha-amylase [Lentinus tigrinus ALCF2SS1-7]|uniref:alpha-amylase n=1 Tax=Lentinus tigrinus ALCF2SS1-6 TaxID=1328759 RepID=A0A5C2SPS7_9APHY|nr:alpha-amylase [Lentinus tigrinus ALCF2SS1-6]RPD79783.1 alpha-amylase [Lentinus tigrinus ALCF2SS1-7]
MQFLLNLLLSASLLTSVYAASADEWRKRSIYQILTDRFALPKGADLNACDPGKQTFCGGTWNTIRDNLDYIQNAGFTAIWISPVSQNYEGPRTPYGDPYHGYWIADATKLNSRFGSADDLKALSDELHRRDMFLMVDVVVNNVMSLETDLSDLSTYMFKDKAQYHSYCPIQWGNTTSEQNCWLGDTNVTLPDVNTQDPGVVSAYTTWIKALVDEFKIDGLRIDAAKHVNMDFWPQFCGAAGVYCIGEVFDADAGQALQYQGPKALDAILNYPLYNALVDAFAIPGKQNMSALTDMVAQIKAKSTDPTLLGNFLEDQDVPRWANISVDPQSMWNAMVFSFMADGIPIVYYGQEQGFSGNADPYNREPLWPSNYQNTTSYAMITKLNQLRNFMINSTSDWITTPMEVLNTTPQGIVFSKGDITTVLTNIGSPPANISVSAKTSLASSVSATTDILTCRQYAVGSGGTIEVEYSRGGVPVILVPDSSLSGSGLCGHELATGTQAKGSQGIVSDNGVARQLSRSATPLALVAALLMGAASLAL